MSALENENYKHFRSGDFFGVVCLIVNIFFLYIITINLGNEKYHHVQLFNLFCCVTIIFIFIKKYVPKIYYNQKDKNRNWRDFELMALEFFYFSIYFILSLIFQFLFEIKFKIEILDKVIKINFFIALILFFKALIFSFIHLFRGLKKLNNDTYFDDNKN